MPTLPDPLLYQLNPETGMLSAIMDPLTKRERFAGMALCGLMSQMPLPESSHSTARICCEVADALIAALNKPKNG